MADGENTGAPSGTGTETPSGGGGNATPWYQGADQETLGYLQNRGLHEKTAAEAAFAAIQSHRSAEAMLGVPENERLRIPKADDAAAVRAFWNRLGAPTDAAGYDFSEIRVGDQPLDTKFTDFFRVQADKLNLPLDTAKALAREFANYNAGEASAKAAEVAAKLETDRSALKQNWGPKFDANLIVAKGGAAKLGVTPEAVAALESQMGYANVMEMFRKVGALTGEDAFIGGGPAERGGIMTREQAAERVSALKADKEWTARYMNGGVNEAKEMQNLLTIMVGDDTNESKARVGMW